MERLPTPHNFCILPLSASVRSGTPDTNAANNFAGTNITVTNYLSSQLKVATCSSQGQMESMMAMAIMATQISPNLRQEMLSAFFCLRLFNNRAISLSV
jgi:hypothetical protein